MDNIREVLEFMEDNDVKFVRLAFTDIFGNLKNMSINVDEFEKAYYDGLAFDASLCSGFMNFEASDLLLFPNLETMTILPWRPSSGRVIRFFCDIKHMDGTFFEGDSRHILNNALLKCDVRYASYATRQGWPLTTR